VVKAGKRQQRRQAGEAVKESGSSRWGEAGGCLSLRLPRRVSRMASPFHRLHSSTAASLPSYLPTILPRRCHARLSTISARVVAA